MLVLNSCCRHPEQVSRSLCGLFFSFYKMRKLYYLWGPFTFQILSPLWNYLFIVLGIISTVVKMFMSPLSPPHVSQILPIHISDILMHQQEKKVLFWGVGNQSCLTLLHLTDVCLADPGAGFGAKQTHPQTSGTLQFGWQTSQRQFTRSNWASLGGYISNQGTDSKWNKPMWMERQSLPSVVKIGVGILPKLTFLVNNPVQTLCPGNLMPSWFVFLSRATIWFGYQEMWTAHPCQTRPTEKGTSSSYRLPL